MTQEWRFDVKAGRAYELRFMLQSTGEALTTATFDVEFVDASGQPVDTRVMSGAGIIPALAPAIIEVWPQSWVSEPLFVPETGSFSCGVRRYILTPPDAIEVILNGHGSDLLAAQIDINPIEADWASDQPQNMLADFALAAAEISQWVRGKMGTQEGAAAQDAWADLFAVPIQQYEALINWLAPSGDWSVVLDRFAHKGNQDEWEQRRGRLAAQADHRLPVVGFIGSPRGQERLEGYACLVWLRPQKLEEQLGALACDVIVIESALASGATQTDWSLAFSSLTGETPAEGLRLFDAAAKTGVPVHLWMTGDPVTADLWRDSAQRADRVIAEGTGWGDLAVDTYVPLATEPAACSLASPFPRESHLMLVPVAADLIHDRVMATALAGGHLYQTLFTDFRYAFNRSTLKERLGQRDVSILGDVGRAEQRTLLQAATLVLLDADGPRSDAELVQMAIDAIACGAIPVLFGAARSDDKLLAALDCVTTRADLMTLQGLYQIRWYHERRWRGLMRQVTTDHVWTSADRAAVLGADPMAVDFDCPMTSVVLVTKRPHLLARCFETFRQQDWPNTELILVFNAKDIPQDIPQLRSNERVFALSEAASLGECLNRGIEVARGRYWCKMDDDDFYSRRYLSDTVMYYRSTQADVVGRQSGFFYFDGKGETYSRGYVEVRHYTLLQPGQAISGATLSADMRWAGAPFSVRHRSHADADWVSRVNQDGNRIFSAGNTDMVVYRDAVEDNHTWHMTAAMEAGQRYESRAGYNMFGTFERVAGEDLTPQDRIAAHGAHARSHQPDAKDMAPSPISASQQPQTDTLQSAYLDLQQRYDGLENDILYAQRQKFEAKIAETESLQAKLTEARDMAEKLRLRLEHFAARRERHLEERAQNRQKIESLRSALAQARQTPRPTAGAGHPRRANRKGNAPAKQPPAPDS